MDLWRVSSKEKSLGANSGIADRSPVRPGGRAISKAYAEILPLYRAISTLRLLSVRRARFLSSRTTLTGSAPSRHTVEVLQAKRCTKRFIRNL
jgi:hypothetical protein